MTNTIVHTNFAEEIRIAASLQNKDWYHLPNKHNLRLNLSMHKDRHSEVASLLGMSRAEAKKLNFLYLYSPEILVVVKCKSGELKRIDMPNTVLRNSLLTNTGERILHYLETNSTALQNIQAVDSILVFP